MKIIALIALLWISLLGCNRTLKGSHQGVRANDIYQRNQQITFTYTDFPETKDYTITRRVAGIPGDTVIIRKEELFVNSQHMPHPASTKFLYTLNLKYTDDEIESILDTNLKNYKGQYRAFFTEAESKEFASKFEKAILSMQKGYDVELNQQALLKFSNNLGWTLDDFGPVVIPRQGQKVTIDFASKFLNTFQKTNDSDSVVIDQPYYFVIADNNFHDHTDSRFIGLIGEKQTK